LTQGDVERSTGMLRAYISRVEHGHTVPSLEIIERFAAFFNIPLYQMFHFDAGDIEKTSLGGSEPPFLTLLAGYVRRMAVAERDLLIALATRLAEEREDGDAVPDKASGRPPRAAPRGTDGSRLRHQLT
jgi:transcriptional regulator with XRE-family HTH domain